MKVLHVFPFFSLKHAGGTCDLIYKLCRAQSQRGYEVTVMVGEYKLDKEYADSLEGVRIMAFPSYLNRARLYVMPGMIKVLKETLREYDVVHLHVSRTFQNWIVCHYAHKYSVPYVVDSHGSAPRHTRRRLAKWIYDKIVGFKMLEKSAKCIAETQVGIREYKELGVNEEKIVLIQPPFPVEDFNNLPKEGGFRNKFRLESAEIIMFLGRIHWIKGIDFLVDAFSELVKERKSAKLVILGPDDGVQTSLERQVEKLGIKDQVLFPGFMNGNAKFEALVDADVVVQTSRYEQGAWAPIEAVLCNTPIIVSNNSGAGEDVARMDAGYLVNWGDVRELKDMMAYVLDNAAVAGEKTARAKRFVMENLSMSNKILEYEMCYKECIGEKAEEVKRGIMPEKLKKEIA